MKNALVVADIYILFYYQEKVCQRLLRTGRGRKEKKETNHVNSLFHTGVKA